MIGPLQRATRAPGKSLASLGRRDEVCRGVSGGISRQEK